MEDRDQLVKKMLPLLDKAEKKSNDAALLLAVDTIDSSLRAALGKAKPAASGAGQTGIVQGPEQPTPVAPAPVRPIRPAEPGISLGGWILIALAVFAGLWLLSALLRAISGARGGAGPGGAYGGAGGGFGGGGFFGSLMAGMFGAAAGSWLYDTFLRGGGSGHAFGAAPDAGMVPGNEPGAGDFSGDPGGGGDFGDDAGDTGGGGDFGDSGAGDFGGGDFGGGDFGGGDFGGGDFGS